MKTDYSMWLTQFQRKPESSKNHGNSKIKRFLKFSALILILAALLFNLIKYPLSGSVYDVIHLDKETVTEIKISHMGKTLYVMEENEISALLHFFDRRIKRGGNTYISKYTSGSQWGISFQTSKNRKGVFSNSFAFLPSHSPSDRAMIQSGAYRYYFEDPQPGDSLLEEPMAAEYGE